MKRKLNKILISCSCVFMALVMLFVIAGSNFLFHKFTPPANPDSFISNGGNNPDGDKTPNETDDSNDAANNDDNPINDGNNDENNNNNTNEDTAPIIPPDPEDTDLDDYELNETENFVYSLIYADLTKQYDTFIGYVPLPTQSKTNELSPASATEDTSSEAYGISYVDYEEAYIDDNGKTYFSAGFISFPNEPTITESNIETGLEIISLEEETDEQFSYVYSYDTEDVHMHCIIDNKYVQYDIVDGVLQYKEEPFVEGMEVEDSRGNIYSYDIEDYVYIIEEIDYVPVSGVSLVGEADYQAIIDEVNRILETQEAHFTYAQIEQFVSQSQEALTSYLLGLQEETFLGYATADLIETAKNLDPMQHLQIGVDETGNSTIKIIEVIKVPSLLEKILTTVICSCGIVGGIALNFIVPPILGSVISGAVIGAAIEGFTQIVVNNNPAIEVWPQICVAAAAGAIAGGVSGYFSGMTTSGVGHLFAKEAADVLCDGFIGGTEFFVNSLFGGATFEEAVDNFGAGLTAGIVLGSIFKIGSATVKEAATLVKKADTSPYIITKVNSKAVKKAGKEAIGNALSETQEKAIRKNATKTAKKSLKNTKKYFDDNQTLYRVGNKLTPKTTFIKNGYKYVTDDFGRVYRVTGDLHLATGKRIPINVSMDDVGKGFELITDHRGHIIGARFGGSNSLENLVPQNSKLNQSAYRSLEDSWAKALKEGKKVSVDIELIYKENSFRPSGFEVNYSIDGVKQKAQTFIN